MCFPFGGEIPDNYSLKGEKFIMTCSLNPWSEASHKDMVETNCALRVTRKQTEKGGTRDEKTPSRWYPSLPAPSNQASPSNVKLWGAFEI